MAQPARNPRDLMGEDIRQDVLNAKQSLPPVPGVLAKARLVASSPRSNLSDLAAVLETDSALTVRVLHLANSAYYRRGAPASGIQQACVAVGMQALLSLVVIISMERLMLKRLESYDLNPDMLFRHALGVAFAARIIASHRVPALTEDAFTAGVLHDVGKMILDPYLVARGVKWPAALQSRHLCVAEQDTLGIDHADMGASFCAHWQMPEEQVNAVRYHHHPDHEDAHPLANVLHLADFLAHTGGLGPDVNENGESCFLVDDCLKKLRFTEEDLEPIREQMMEAVADTSSKMFSSR